MTKTILKATDICKIYDLGETKIHALKNVSLELFENDFLAIVGKSGSGKSTLMHILGLLDTPTSGELILKDKNVTKYTPNQLAHIRNEEIGFVFQFFNLLQRTSTLDNVILPLKYSHVPKNQWEDKAKKMLEIVDLGDRLQNKSNELSGGQKQRVAIARALVNDPAIIFADEPTGNLDSKTGDEIVALFKKLHSQGKTIIIVTHDDDLAKIAERKIVLRDGIIV
ncbi:macrolide ABC transporter ATP-binding protein [candidate division WWE3 bacterium RIFOXYC1_FULL_40_10]|uniref:Macrolide ABC transporter ATP-binding protein n=1 Tax=candidate division WWE3 bacterium RIFOXYA2_FULL_46_9 TaxID=1802636 RepID=A0A1F4W1K4_UNCKA|nr:MAG: macrolide ABC transporter ATP-binding protein [candidate division WWE3 bacterium RIFOXYB1_FULL_40_22]OGC61655.1 MAG: macrolide ABC transporter ATP-binding protein [candidate division WWE3 bacterium RIFOXYA1_FULL_40_11]OGC63281.1 MAG: macrolide ABC transporter ATP-binding protein [candidate division WWE3 bacterium RIFOXYA2_FULL_46_9]OGC64412.1 MAG: macrolide ABC transporter ATP-binding protein [candidate division WWE3 bacterium RIFOXYB2_FULL_41_6]OGC66038.1 MAG: macrolide ABC transporter